MNCKACGETVVAADEAKTRGYCQECFAELFHGKIPPPPGPQYQTHASHLTPRQAAKLGKTDGG